MKSTYLNSIIKQFEYYKSLGEKTMAQVPEEKLFWQYNKDSNSMATITKHLWGNMLSRWTDFLNSDGEKMWRQREAEFDNDIKSRKELMDKWNEGWKCLFNAISPLTDADLEKEIYIRNQGHSVTEAINRQLAHYAYHIGQMVFLGKMICGENWKSLSIPRGKSEAFNSEKFAKPRHREHFTDQFIQNRDE